MPGTATGGVPEVSLKLVVLSVAGSMASLKVALTTPLTGTPVAPSRGRLETTVGATGGTTALPVLKLQVCRAASAPPAMLLAPVVMLAV